MRSDLDPAIGMRNGILICLMSGLVLWLLVGCATFNPQYTSQTIEWSGTIHLYTEQVDRDNYCSRLVGREVTASCYNRKDRSIHVMKWDGAAAGHELWHGLAIDGTPRLIVEDRFDHFKVRRKFKIRRHK